MIISRRLVDRFLGDTSQASDIRGSNNAHNIVVPTDRASICYSKPLSAYRILDTANSLTIVQNEDRKTFDMHQVRSEDKLLGDKLHGTVSTRRRVRK